MKINYLKKLMLFSFVGMHQFLFSQSWISQVSGPGGQPNFMSVSMANSMEGAAVGTNINGGSLRYTSDSGLSWSTGANSAQTMNSIDLNSSSLGWMVGTGGQIWKTTTVLGSWGALSSPTTNTLYTVEFVDNNTGWIAGGGGLLFKSTDGGTSWAAKSTGLTSDIRALDAIDLNTIWIVGSGGNIKKSTNGGDAWNTLPSGTTTVTFTDVFFVNSLVGWVVGTNGTIKKSIDGGNTWTNQTSGTTATLRAIHFVSGSIGWAVGDNGTILNTINGGSTWTTQVSGTTQNLNGVYMTSEFEGWAVGNSGVIRKYCTNPSTPSSITGANLVCVGATETYSVPNQLGATFTWSFPAGWTQISGGTTNTVTVTVGATNGNVSVVPSNSCGSASPATLATTFYNIPSQPSIISGNNSPCVGSTEVYSVSNVSGVDYIWTLPPGWTQTAGGTTNSITVTVGSISGDIEVIQTNFCGNGPSRTLSIVTNDIPAQPTLISGNITPCEGTNENYSVPNIPVNYSWTLPLGWSLISGGSSNDILVQIGSTGSATIQVTPSNVCGNGPSQTLNVVVNDLPSQPSVISGNNSVCEGNLETFSIINESGVDYNWTFPATWTLIGSGNTNTVNLQIGAGSGNVIVEPSNVCGAGPIQSLLVSTTSINSSITVYDDSLGLTVNELGSTYQWLNCDNAYAPISGETSMNYSPSISGNYAVEITKNGCVDTSSCEFFDILHVDELKHFALEVFPNPTTAKLTVLSNLLVDRIEIVNVYGQLLNTIPVEGDNKVEIELNSTPGIYFVKTYFLNSKIIEITKITKQ